MVGKQGRQAGGPISILGLLSVAHCLLATNIRRERTGTTKV